MKRLSRANFSLMIAVFLFSIVSVLSTMAVHAQSDTWICPECGAVASGNFCTNCGKPNPSSDWVCPNCGNTVTGNFCSECGTPRNSSQDTSASENTAGVEAANDGQAAPVQADGSQAAPAPSDGSQDAPAGSNSETVTVTGSGQTAERATAYMDFVSSDVSEYPNVKLYFEYTDEYADPITLNSMTGDVKERIAGGAEIERTVRKIQKLEGNEGLSIDIVADKSASMDEDLPQMQSIMRDFVSSLDYSHGDRVEILSFDTYVMYMCTYTQDVSLMQNGIDNMVPDGDTALYDALVTGIMNAGSQAGARCVIGFTDGEDNQSVYTPQEVIRLALQREVPVYLIGTSWADSDTLEYICDETGGYYWDVDNIYDVSQILQTIYSDRKEMYCVEYESDPNADPYALRRINCSLGDEYYIGTVTDLEFQATPAIKQAAHTSRYEVFRENVSWKEANDACIARGGHLATITSQPEMDQLVSMCEGAGIKYCWIGGYTSIRNGTAFGHWITGEPFSYTAWYPGEPSRNDKDGTPEFYLMLWKVENAWSWNDQREDVLHSGLDYFKGNIGYICEYES